MKSLYKRQFVMMAGMILVSFALLGAAFITLSYRYTVQEKRDSMERNADYIAAFTSAMYSSGFNVRDDGYQVYVSSIARISDAYVLVTAADGQVILSADGNTLQTGSTGYTLPQSVVAQVQKDGRFTGITTLGGLFPEKRYVAGTPVQVNALDLTTGQTGLKTIAVVYMAADTSSITEMWRAFASIFFFTAVVVLARRSEFVANISHELKTPMTTIAGFSDGILDGTITPDHEKAALQTISSETRRLSRLVRRMLDLSRLQSAENITAQEQFDVSEVLLRVLVSLETKINARHLDVDTQIPEGAVLVWGDPDSITQVCYNLLDNAIKFSAEGSTLGLSITTKGGKAYVSVRNTGQTIPPEELPLIFDRFHKSDKSRSVDREGVGLGLYIVKTILNSHKENITVSSENGVTEFVFTLTLA